MCYNKRKKYRKDVVLLEVFCPVIVALVFNGVDLLTGLIGAIKNHDVQSAKLRDGIFKKIGFLICYALAFLLDNYGGTIGINISVNILPIVIAYVVFTEVVSIIENISIINPDLLPDKLMDLFHLQVTDDVKHSNDDNTSVK